MPPSTDAGESLRDAGEAIRATVHTLSAPRRRRRRPDTPALFVLLAAGVAVAGIGAWWIRRSTASAARLPSGHGVDTTTSARLDREAVDRATDEGMGTTPGAHDRLAATLADEGALDSLADAPQRPLVPTGPGIAGTGDLSMRSSAGIGSSPQH